MAPCCLWSHEAPIALQNELLGRNVNKVSCVDDQGKKEMLSKLFQRYTLIRTSLWSLGICADDVGS
jgi:hypothetical protein